MNYKARKMSSINTKHIKKYLFAALFVMYAAFTWGQKKHEMRMVWIATVSNIDWTPNREFDPAKQQKAMVAMLDTFSKLNINAIALQIRPTADAFYQSNIEPWSHFLTGEQGKAPSPYYDPLEFTINEAHKRNIDVHVWINPYRLLNSDNLDILHKNNIFFKKPEMFLKYGSQYFFNPSHPETLKHLQNVVADIVSRYDIDAVHIDDYFYPYPIKGREFPDEEDFRANPRGFHNKNDWRRDNVNRAIDMISSTIKRIKPYVEFGVSPFGVWRNKNRDPRGSDTKALSNYDDLYADILKWIDEGKIDYVIPQLYWEIGHRSAEYNTLAEWWNANSDKTNLYIGLFASNIGNKSAARVWQTSDELCRQIKLNYQYDNIKGVGLYSAVALMQNRMGIADSLRNNFFRHKALVPHSPKMSNKQPAEPKKLKMIFDYNRQKIYLQWKKPSEKDLKYYIIYRFGKNEPIDTDSPKNIFATTRNNYLDITQFILNNYSKKMIFAVSSVNRYNVESEKYITVEY